MTDEASVSTRQDAYLRWRQRIADKQAARRQPEETAAAKPNSLWDPEALFRADEPSRPAPDEGANREPTIDLRDAAETAVTPEPLDSPAPPRPRQDAQPQRGLESSCARPDIAAKPMAPRRDPRKERFDSVMARLQDSTTSQEAPIPEALRELNQHRLGGIITDEEFNARKTELFERASRH